MSTYTPEWYARIAAGARRSAEIVVPWVAENLGLDSSSTVIDVGCGQGFWGAAFARLSCEVIGIDGDYVDDPLIPMLTWDLERPLPAAFLRADLVVCLEVAEHLSPERADGFVAELCEMAPLILWSAAVPGQGGNRHVNCQWPSWWAPRFRAHGRYFDDRIRHVFWHDRAVEPWYRQNMMLATPAPALEPGDVRHPECV